MPPIYTSVSLSVLALFDTLRAEIQQDFPSLTSDQIAMLDRRVVAKKAEVPARLEIQQD